MSGVRASQTSHPWFQPGKESARKNPLKAAQAHAQGWSMESLAERYIDVYQRAIAAYARGEHS